MNKTTLKFRNHMNSELYEAAFIFAINIVELNKQLVTDKEYIISKQIIRSGTSIGANIAEAMGSIYLDDKISKYDIALKEAHETRYWLDLLVNSSYISEEKYNELYDDVGHIIRMLAATIKTLRGKKEK